MSRISATVTLTPRRYRRLSNFARTRSPVAVLVWPIKSTIVSNVRSTGLAGRR